MIILNVTQGSPEWREARAKHFCASEAPAMMGASSYMTRTELIRRKATGDVPEVDAITQSLFDRGHAAEDAAREHLESELGEELYPATGTDETGYLLASFDGITMDGETGFEHKLWNEELAAHVRAGQLPPMYFWQLEQQCFIAGLKRVIFVVSDGTPERWERLDYAPVPGRSGQLLAGWRQFEEDVKNYQHVEALPPPTGKALMALPALTVQLVGEVKESNLVVYRQTALAFINAINTDLQTDQDFADAEKTVKFCGDAERELESVKEVALSQTVSIDELFRTVDMLREEMRGKRLELEKLVKARKESIREEIRREGISAAVEHLGSLNKRLGQQCMPAVLYDFAAVMKGRKTISSLRDAVNTELARFKIEANAMADRIQINLGVLREAGHQFLFADVLQIIVKANDDFEALVKMRISDHQAKEAKREEEQRERIRLEELAKIEAKRVKDEAAARLKPDAKPPMPARPDIVEQTQTAPVAKPAVTIVKGSIRPTDEAIIQALGQHFRVVDETVIRWLGEMDLDAARKRAMAA